MNINAIKENIEKNLGKNVTVTLKCIRNRKEIYEGKLYKIYPNIFSVYTRNGEKTFSYVDVVTRDIIIKYE